MKKAVRLVCLLLLALCSIAAWAQDEQSSDADSAKTDADSAKTGEKAPEIPLKPVVPSDYVIGADDTLRIAVWKEPDLSVQLPVRPDGKISMPLVDDVQAAGLTPMQLANSLKEKLKKYIADPHVTVVVTAMASQRIYVLGEVQHTGPMALLPNMTIMQALSSAGFTQFANLKGIYLLRMQDGQQVKARFNYKEAIKGNDPAKNYVLKPGDTIVVP
jgi:polysaccharide export outer membrane protein